jgi:hypothetical protein
MKCAPNYGSTEQSEGKKNGGFFLNNLVRSLRQTGREGSIFPDQLTAHVHRRLRTAELKSISHPLGGARDYREIYTGS